MESNIYVCGMQPIGEDHHCHGIFQCYPELTCTLPVEADFHTCKRPLMAADRFTRDLIFCAICDGACQDFEGGKDNSGLKTIYTIVLPICNTCKSTGAKIVVGRYTHNGKTYQQRLNKVIRIAAVAAQNEQPAIIC